MSILNAELAESIVKRTMKVVDRNINIMNESGIIIASGDKDRIGTIHEGAIIAIQRKDEFVIDEKQSKQLGGVQPGVNLVIEFHDEAVGAIGVTGRPREVLSYAKLIKMTAEMIIEQDYVMKEIRWNNKIKEEIILSLIHNKEVAPRLLEEYMKKFRIPQNHPLAIFIIEAKSRDASIQEDLKMSHRVVDILEGNFKESLAVVIDANTAILLHKCSKNCSSLVDYEEKLKEVNENIYNNTGIRTIISAGKIYDKLTELYRSYEIANQTLQFGKKMYRDKDIYIFDKLKDAMLFFQFNRDWRAGELKLTYELLAENDKNGELRDTLRVLVEENGELKNVANRLFIHRNSLNYRLSKIYAITNKNPKRYADLFWLYSSVINFQMGLIS